MLARTEESALVNAGVNFNQLHAWEGLFEGCRINGRVDHQKGRTRAVCFVEGKQQVGHRSADAAVVVWGQLSRNEYQSLHQPARKLPRSQRSDTLELNTAFPLHFRVFIPEGTPVTLLVRAITSFFF